MDAMAFLSKPGKQVQPIYVVCGDEDFLKRRALAVIEKIVLEDADPAFAMTTYVADAADFSTIRNELDTRPFLAPRRLVIVEQADPFVSEHRPKLEKLVASPGTSGVLVLEVRTWPATTKLAKQVPDAATIVCKAPTAQKLFGWCTDWCKSNYNKKLSPAAGHMLIELVGPQMGLLDAELAKLAIYVGDQPIIEEKDVDALIGRSRSANVFKILDAVGEGKPGDALTILGELFEEGEDPIAILGALGSQLRKLAKAGSLMRIGYSVDEAMEDAGVAKWPAARDSARKQLQHLGQSRVDKLFAWLLETDLGMKGGSALPPRLVLERLLVQLAKPGSAA
ncbi:DNA polymerase III subunit delta [Tuwongella immobilis]|uniref:DNA polymerase III subunit delta n=1 Tax=Tuwongella immobilis TaxID=692036 RepID=A0A6C2YI21_9BACT|nr:DNA polymerase III subunit delta [Tuwongella immobilis]VIP00642.1 dna polymerase iii subunit delta : DNA polymerase III, delta subunit OS=Singulisphaera acidiphila (strain ATCC BAA-1392 / DSM 18658 / VKM B-2454 / MOB10) GN=Sinac_2977 PE=4 SV=1: DNA_pol3_delta [Tuwongella immobilis]VTR96702.1 dna polymerase iii subunit delta : DNA polymerase III, delta subunit OS=Singulisphaera acidiphila (strain ATCC BAA-1392 / DSM 18658 / VKM B-2454 / MOB10) GN=Sinac_2977 PE=4 SV=1: DNA_pol3_delta [Tuwongella